MDESGESLLAVDLGLRTGLACFGRGGRLNWYRSRNFGSRARLKKAAGAVLREAGQTGRVTHLAIEGGGDLAIPWLAECRRMKVDVLQVGAEEWRNGLLLSRERRSGADAKKHAGLVARQIIEWSGAKRPTSLRHDAAEAICLGFWAVQEVGWLSHEDASEVEGSR